MKLFLPFLALLPLSGAPLFEITKHPNPVAIDPQIGGLTVLPDGRIAAAFAFVLAESTQSAVPPYGRSSSGSDTYRCARYHRYSGRPAILPGR